MPELEVAGGVASSALVLGRDLHGEASALAEILVHEGVDAAIARRVDDADMMNAIWHRDMAIIDGDVVAVPGLMPLLTGLRAFHPELPLLLLTSWPPGDPRIAPALAAVEGWYLMKPVDVAELVDTVRTVAALRRAGKHNPLQRGAVHRG